MPTRSVLPSLSVLLVGLLACGPSATSDPKSPSEPAATSDGGGEGAGGESGDDGGTGEDGGDSGGDDGGGDSSGDCEPSGEPTRSPLRRLSHAQYQHAVSDLVTEFLGPEVGESDWLAYKWLDEWALLLPVDLPTGEVDQTRGGYRRLDQAVFQQHAEAWAVIAMGISDEFQLGHVWTIESYFDHACSPFGDRDCVERWIRELGPRAHRLPLTEDDVTHYLSVYDDTSDAWLADNPGDGWQATDRGTVAVTAAMLMSPWFTHHVELGDPDRGDDVLTAHELANRLSFHFWQTAPDAELTAAASDGTLLDDAVYEAQVRRLVADARTSEALAEFFEDWLITDHIPAMHARVGTEPYDDFSAGYTPAADLHTAMADELRDLGIWHSVTQPSDFDTFFRSDLVLTDHHGLAQLYGLGVPWSGEGDPPVMADAQRAGLLTRAGLLATGSANTRPIVKGVFAREQLLCQPMPPPPDDVNAVAPAPSEEETTREVVQTLTEVSGSSCEGCHKALINPLGFATEGFDALGRPRTMEVLYSAAGEPVGSAPIDSETSVFIDGTTYDVSDAHDLTSVILESGQAHACFARNQLRFALGRVEHHDSEDCTIEALGAALASGLTLDEFMVTVALLPEFKRLAKPGGE